MCRIRWGTTVRDKLVKSVVGIWRMKWEMSLSIEDIVEDVCVEYVLATK